MNANGVAEMYGIQNHHGRYYAGDILAYYYWTRFAEDGRSWPTEAEVLAYMKKHEIIGKVVKLDI